MSPRPGGGRPLGLVAGAGALPALVAHQARAAGWRVVAFVLDQPGELAGLVQRVVPCRVGELGPVLAVLAEERVRHLVLAGRVGKDGLFRGLPLDEPARALLGRSADWSDGALLGAIAAGLDALGVELLDQRAFLGGWLAPPGLLAGPPPAPAVAADLERGLAVARAVAGLGVGQTVVVRAGAVVAVEGLEGTDEAVRRGLALAGAGATVVKAASPAHDYRFDTPAVGGTTAALCARGRAAALGIEAGRVLLLDREAVAAEAARAGMSVVGIEGDGAGA